MQKLGYNYVLGINVTEFYVLHLADVDLALVFIFIVSIVPLGRGWRNGRVKVLSLGKCFCKH